MVDFLAGNTDVPFVESTQQVTEMQTLAMLPPKTRSALKLLITLALEQNQHASLAKLCERACVSQSTGEQLFSRLRQAGIVKGTRGPGGGYQFVSPGGEEWKSIGLGTIILAIMEDDEKGKPHDSSVPAGEIDWTKLSELLIAHYNLLTLGDCLEYVQVG